MTFVAKSLLNEWQLPNHLSYQLTTSFLAGGISGFACVPFENIAQNKQLMAYTSNQLTLKKIYQYHGLSGLFQGSMSIVAREGLWAMVYLTAIPAMIRHLEAKDYGPKEAKFLASFWVAGGFGLMTAPLNQLRFKKQEGLCQAKLKKSYFAYVDEIWHQAPEAKISQRLGFFFKGAGARMLTTTCAGAFMLKATETYDRLLSR